MTNEHAKKRRKYNIEGIASFRSFRTSFRGFSLQFLIGWLDNDSVYSANFAMSSTADSCLSFLIQFSSKYLNENIRFCAYIRTFLLLTYCIRTKEMALAVHRNKINKSVYLDFSLKLKNKDSRIWNQAFTSLINNNYSIVLLSWPTI